MLYAKEMVDQKIQNIAEHINYSAECIDGCDKRRATYLLKRIGDTPTSNPERYVPDEIGIFVVIAPFVENAALSKYDSLATGFDVKWMSENINGFQFVMVSDNTSRGSNVEFILGEDGLPTISGDLRFPRTELGRKIMRSLHDTPHTFFGSSEMFYNVLYFNDRVYHFYGDDRFNTFKDYADPAFQSKL